MAITESIRSAHLRGDHDPGIPLQLDIPLPDAETAQPVEVVHDALRERQVLSGGEPGEPTAGVL
nr:hypothetical protein [Streptomyces tailanensis]